jgi:lipocalin
MSGSIEHNAAIKIQLVFKLNNCIKCLEEFNKLNLKTLASTKSFLEFQKFITNKNTSPNMINTINKFILSLNKFKNGLTIKSKIIVTAYIINYFPDEFLGSNENKHPIDINLINLAKIMLNSIDNGNINDIWNSMRDFNIAALQWFEMDKERSIEQMIISYHNRSEHINYIKEKQMDFEQQMDMVNEVEKERTTIINCIKQIDNKFDVEFLKENHDKISYHIIKSREEISKALVTNMKRAYFNMLYRDISNGEMMSTFNDFKAIAERLLAICPAKRLESFKKKFTDDVLLNLLSETGFTNSLIGHINMIVDYISIMDAPVNDMNNKEWKVHINSLMTRDKSQDTSHDASQDTSHDASQDVYNENLPRILIEIEEHLDTLIENIIKHCN